MTGSGTGRCKKLPVQALVVALGAIGENNISNIYFRHGSKGLDSLNSLSNVKLNLEAAQEALLELIFSSLKCSNCQVKCA